MESKRYYGFFTTTSFVGGRVSVQVVDGSRGDGFATEKTARAKLAARLAAPRKAPIHAGTDVVIAFPNSAAVYRYLAEANRLVQGR